MPSFDIVSKIDNHELMNAVDQANREITTRFDFKDVNAKFILNQNKITLIAPNDFQVKQMQEILQNKLIKRNIEIKSLKFGSIESNLAQAKQEADVQEGINVELAKKITKNIKNSKLKVQASLQGDQIRVAGKSRDDLQKTIAFLKEQEFEQALQFTNFRD